jgi:hypothetical protein
VSDRPIDPNFDFEHSPTPVRVVAFDEDNPVDPDRDLLPPNVPSEFVDLYVLGEEFSKPSALTSQEMDKYFDRKSYARPKLWTGKQEYARAKKLMWLKVLKLFKDSMRDMVVDNDAAARYSMFWDSSIFAVEQLHPGMGHLLGFLKMMDYKIAFRDRSIRKLQDSVLATFMIPQLSNVHRTAGEALVALWKLDKDGHRKTHTKLSNLVAFHDTSVYTRAGALRVYGYAKDYYVDTAARIGVDISSYLQGIFGDSIQPMLVRQAAWLSHRTINRNCVPRWQ